MCITDINSRSCERVSYTRGGGGVCRPADRASMMMTTGIMFVIIILEMVQRRHRPTTPGVTSGPGPHHQHCQCQLPPRRGGGRAGAGGGGHSIGVGAAGRRTEHRV